MGSFKVKDNFYLNDKEFKIISGGMHYFRTVPEYWRDRLEKLKALGCNTVETYVPWNMHEPEKGKFCFGGILDLEAFIKLAQELELWVIIRPSPYICAEWEFGGLPAWLLADESMKLRTSDELFMKHLIEYYTKLFQILTPLQITNGGPIILYQVENEYGYYCDDKKYLEELRNIMLLNGCTIPMVTSDGPWGDALAVGSLEGVLPTANFGSRGEEQFEVLKKHTNGGPLMCMEFWVGWFDSWGSENHQTGDIKEHAKDLEYILQHGHVNIYMFHGGTNFGFMNGSNYYDKLSPDVTSYDYDALLTEDGECTAKYFAFQEVIKQFIKLPEVKFSTVIKKKDYGRIFVKEKVGLFEALPDISQEENSSFPKSMEKLGQNYGYILYRTQMNHSKDLAEIRLWEANDRAHIFVDEELVATLYDRELLSTKKFEPSIPFVEGKLDILVENMGRVNFGPMLEKQQKGIHRMVQVNQYQHVGWSLYTLPLDNLERLNYTRGYKEGRPAFYRFAFDVSEIGDTFLDFTGWGKGCIFVNGFNIGRFWEVGPQRRLYIPGPLLHIGENEIIVFETEGKVADSISLLSKPDLGCVTD